MSVKMRLTRMGDKKSPFYRIVVTDSRQAANGAYIEQVGHFNPTTVPETVEIDKDLAKEWLGKGALPTLTVRNLLIKQGVLPKPTKQSASRTKSKKKKEA